MKFSRVVIDSIPHNSTKAIVKAMLEEAVAADTRSQYEAAEYEHLSGEENLTLDCIAADDRRSHQALW